jgi:hypothetical protein
MFGQPGGGGAELPNTPAAAAQVLGAWALGSALVFITVGSLWHNYAASRPRLTRLRTGASAGVARVRTLGGRIAGDQGTAAWAARSRRASGSAVAGRWPNLARLMLTVRAELFVLLRWPAVRALLFCVAVYPWLLTYVEDFFSYWLVPSGNNLTYAMPTLGAGQMLPELLNNLSFGSLWTGSVPLLLIGAWTGGSIWTGGQLRTSLIQRQRRSKHVLGQCLALILLTITATALTFAVAVVSVKVVALLLPHLAAIHTGGKYGTFPPATHVIEAFGAFTLGTGTYALIGLAVGTTLRNPGAAVGVAFLWVLGVEASVTVLLPQLHGALLRIAEALPDAGLARLTAVTGTIQGVGYQGPTISVTTAVLQLAAWSAIAATITTWLIRRTEHA